MFAFETSPPDMTIPLKGMLFWVTAHLSVKG
jgi:hypothetical protein